MGNVGLTVMEVITFTFFLLACLSPSSHSNAFDIADTNNIQETCHIYEPIISGKSPLDTE